MSSEKKVSWKPLCNDVIVVAIEGGCKDWAAYIGSVLGESHEHEW